MKIKKLSNYDEIIETLSNLAKEKSFVFRGYTEKTQMLPKIIRNDLVEVEFELLKGFEKYGMNYVNVNGPFDLVTWAQHYGLSTRLLDFTYNPFVALYFSLYDEYSKNYFIRYCSLNKNILFKDFPVYHYFTFGCYESSSFATQFKNRIADFERAKRWGEEGNENEKEFLSYLEAIFSSNLKKQTAEQIHIQAEDAKNKIQNKKLLFVDTNQSNQRLIMQQGLFLLPYTLDKEELLRMVEENTVEIEIDKKIRLQLLSYLDTMGINAFRLMPDLSNICNAVERHVKTSI